MTKKKEIIIVLIILFFAFAVRAVYVFFVQQPEKYLVSDMGMYYRRALSLEQGGREIALDTFHPPGMLYLYSALLKLPKPFFWIKIFNAIISTATCIFVYLSAKIIWNHKVAFIALILSSFNYLFIYYAGFFIRETPFILSLSVMFFFLLKSIMDKVQKNKFLYSFLAGLFLIISASFRASILLIIPFFGIWWLLNRRKYKLTVNLPFYILGFLPLYIILCFRVYILTGNMGTISTNAGLNFYLGRSHAYQLSLYNKDGSLNFRTIPPVAYQRLYPISKGFEAQPNDSFFFFKEGLKEVRNDVFRAVRYSFIHVYDLFSSTGLFPVSFGPIKFYNHVFVFIVVFPAFILLFSRFQYIIHSLQILPYLAILVIIIVSAIFHGEPRYRVPYDIFFIMIAGYFYSQINFKLAIKRIISKSF